MKAVKTEIVPTESILSIRDIILQTVNTVYSQKFLDISTFVFHGSALLLWLITFEILSLLVTSDDTSDQSSPPFPFNCVAELKKLGPSVLKNMTRVRRKLFRGQCARTHGSSMHWYKPDEIWLSNCETMRHLENEVKNSCAKALTFEEC